MKEDKIFLVDTNILIYAYELEDSTRKEKSLELLQKCFKKEIVLAISNQNLAEFSFVALKKLKLPCETVKRIIKDISNFDGFKKINYKRKTILSAIEILDEYNMTFWDSLLSATMIESEIFNIYTENSKDFKDPKINVVNIF